MPGDADQSRTATESHLKEDVRIMGDDPQVFSDNDDNADGLDVVDQLIRDSTIVTTPGAPLGRKEDPAMR